MDLNNMNFCKIYNKAMKKLNEYEPSVSEINIFTGIANLIRSLIVHVFVIGLVYAIYYIQLFLTYLLMPIENRIHIYKKVISPILDLQDSLEKSIEEYILDIIYKVTTSKCGRDSVNKVK